MKRRDLFPRNALAAARSRGSSRTGEHCPETGWWVVAHTASRADGASRFFVKGSTMPAAPGGAAAWERVAPLGASGI